MAQKKFVPRQRKRRTLDKLRASSTAIESPSSTADVIVPLSKSEREERRAQLKEQVLAQHAESKVSRQKAKRLDKYIQNKLHKEEKADLLKRIVSAQSGIDRSLLKSTKMLGRGREERREVLQRAVQERASGVNVKEAERLLFKKQRAAVTTNDDSSDSEDSVVSVQAAPQAEARMISEADASTFGSGLKRPLELDENGRPIIKRRKRETGKGFKIDLRAPALPVLSLEPSADTEQAEDEWNGFDAEDDKEAVREGWDAIGHSDTDSELESDADIANSETSNTSHENDLSSSNISETDDDDAEEDEVDERPSRTSAFKAWAENQRNDAIGFQPSNILADIQEATKKITFTPRPAESEPLPPELVIPESKDRRTHAVEVRRTDEIQALRMALPVVAKEQEIMEAVFNNDVVIISGATGSGKTTQVPQFLFEHGFGDPKGPTPGLIGVTQPRRVAAVSMAKRVADELSDRKDAVAHQIRFDSTTNAKTAIKFMTDGVLLREMTDDFALKKYSAIIIDEAHERTVNTDILISLMSRSIKARAQLTIEKNRSYTPLKLIIMSATLRVSDFRENSRLFDLPPPLVQAEGRQYDVTVHWSRRTHADFVEEAFKKVSRGHRKLPPGGILAFLTGQNEIRMLTRRLKETFAATKGSGESINRAHFSASEMPLESGDIEDMQRDDAVHDAEESNSHDEGSDVDDEQDLNAEFTIEGESPAQLAKVHVLPLFSQLPSKDQLKIFEAVPDDSRLIVLATNVAETSLTIPGIRYVFDSGRVKERKWDRAGVQTFTTTWVSKASADQRMGRAGRTGPGHCYRLYSSAMYEGFAEFAEPEIYRSPLEGVVLQLKALNIAKVDNFPFPTPPDRSNLVKAERLLCHLGALDSGNRITSLGRELQRYPLNPRFAQMLRLGQLYGCVDLSIAVVAALDAAEIIVSDSMLQLRSTHSDAATQTSQEQDREMEDQRKSYGRAQGHLAQLSSVSDAMKLLMALVTYCEVEDRELACEQYFLRSKALKEANQLRGQLHSIVNSIQHVASSQFSQRISRPTENEVGILRQIIAAGFIDQVAIRADCLPSPPDIECKPKRAIDVRYQTLLPSHDIDSTTTEDDKYVFLHPSSLLARTSAAKVPRYIVYQRLQRSQNTREGSIARTRMHPLTPVSGEQLAVLARGTTLLSVGKPVGKVEVLPRVDGRERRQCAVVLSLVGRAGEVGWPLVRKEVVQRREAGEGWVVEKYCD